MAQSSSAKVRRGAVAPKIGLFGLIRAAFEHHSHTFQDSLKRLAKDPLQTLMTASVIAIALSLPATLFLVVDNARQFENNFESFSQITAYVDNSANQKQIATIKTQLQAIPEVAAVMYISPEQGLQEFTENSGFGSALKYLESNPLPPVFIIEPIADVALEANQVQPLLAKISQIAEVEDTQIDMLWLQRLRSLTQIGQQIVFALGFVLGLGVLVIIGNSIRLTIHGRREEIIVVKLVGGTDAYVRRPFLYSGMLMGLIGAMGAALIIVIGFWWLSGSVAQLSELYNSQFRLHSLGVQGCLALIAVGASLGLSGSWLAVTRHLKDIKPR
ncbi:MAG: permease-like cell division protein FtsX [Porticoccaceae bacterium]|nr:permease-like cell division protein FtsX [Porticoccaceae bacterium]